MKFLSKIASYIKEKDIFAIPVQLTYKGQRKFNTMVGGCCTILLFLMIVISFPILTLYNFFSPSIEQI